jgi:hypothetical protein
MRSGFANIVGIGVFGAGSKRECVKTAFIIVCVRRFARTARHIAHMSTRTTQRILWTADNLTIDCKNKWVKKESKNDY